MSPTVVPGLTDVVGLVSAQGAICAVRRDGSVWCWGTLAPGLDGTLARVAW